MAKATALGKSGSPEPVPPSAPVCRSVTLSNKFANSRLSSGCACANFGGKSLATGAVAGATAAVSPELPAPEPVAVELASPETTALWASCAVIFGTMTPRRQLRPLPTHFLGDQLVAPQGARDDLLEDVDDMMRSGGVPLHEEVAMAFSSGRRPHLRS